MAVSVSRLEREALANILAIRPDQVTPANVSELRRKAADMRADHSAQTRLDAGMALAADLRARREAPHPEAGA